MATVRLNKTLRACVSFARWCRETPLNPNDAAQVLALADKAFAAGVREANTGRSADRQRKAFEAFAKSCGFKTLWPGLLPMLQRGGRQIHLPPI